MIKENMFTKFPVIETKRLILREITQKDTSDIFSILSLEEVVKYYGMYPFTNLSQAENMVEKFRKSFEDSVSIRWGIELKEEKKIIGTCGYHNWNKRHLRAEIGYELHPEFWKNGYATEAVLEIIKYGFDVMNLVRIEAVVYPENNISTNMLKKINFDHEGCLKKYVYFRDKHQDLNMFSLVK